jgi:hypothetical protein
MPTFPTLNQRGDKRTQRINDSPEIDVKHPPPILFRRIKKPPGNSNPGIGHDNVRHPVLNENMLSKPLHPSTVSNINLKRRSPNLRSSPRSSIKINVDTENVDPMRPKLESGSPPNPTPSPGNKSKLPTQVA